ncbi:MAG: DUF4168 domain-containing protein [Cyanobacteria bacterium REEB459]|nr:DUF4168 domain-containing protein [Cyanobacteria bacterium REEB459]
MHDSITLLGTTRITGRSLQALLLASLSVLASTVVVAPRLEGVTYLPSPALAWAQSLQVSPAEVINYARSVLQMDGPRSQAYAQIKSLLSGANYDVNAIDMRCSATANLNQLPRRIRQQIKTIVVDYCNQASDIVRSNGLQVEQFNAITAAYPQDQALAEQIRTALMQMQQQAQPRP